MTQTPDTIDTAPVEPSARPSLARQEGIGLAEALEQFLLRLPATAGATTVRHLDGHISISLNLDAQTTVALTPVLLKHTDLQFEKPTEIKAPAISSRVLIVEDDPLCRMALRNILSKIPGVQITEASNGREAVAKVESGYIPNLCISDFSMPEMDGLQLLQQFRENKRLRNLEFILCTTTTERNVIHRAAELQVSQYMVKPFSAPKVHEQVIKLLEAAHLKANKRLAELTSQIGVDAPTYVGLLQKFSTELTETVTSVRSALAMESWHSANVRLNALLGACSMLRADAVIPSLKRVSLAVKNCDLSAAMDGLDELSGNTRHIKNEAELLAAELNLVSPYAEAAKSAGDPVKTSPSA